MKNFFVSLGLLIFSLNGLVAQDAATEIKAEIKAGPSTRARFRATVGAGSQFYSGELSEVFDSGELGLGAQGEFSVRVSNRIPLYVGLNLGYMNWSFDLPATGPDLAGNQVITDSFRLILPRGASLRAFSFSALPTLTYRFENRSVWQPFLALSVGPNFYTVEASSSSEDPSVALLEENESVQSRHTKVYLQAVLRPGIDWEITEYFGVMADVSLGLLGSRFTARPGVNAIFTF